MAALHTQVCVQTVSEVTRRAARSNWSSEHKYRVSRTRSRIEKRFCCEHLEHLDSPWERALLCASKLTFHFEVIKVGVYVCKKKMWTPLLTNPPASKIISTHPALRICAIGRSSANFNTRHSSLSSRTRKVTNEFFPDSGGGGQSTLRRHTQHVTSLFAGEEVDEPDRQTGL